MRTNEIVLFETEDRNIVLPVNVEKGTVWLSANQMAILFERDEKTIRKHVNNSRISQLGEKSPSQ